MCDLNLDDRCCLLHGKGNKEREVWFSAKTQLSIKEYISSSLHREYLFCKADGSGISNHTIGDIVRKIGKRAGVSNTHTHRFRKTAATFFAYNMPIQNVSIILGHSSLDTTNSYYIESNRQKIKDQAKTYAL